MIRPVYYKQPEMSNRSRVTNHHATGDSRLKKLSNWEIFCESQCNFTVIEES